MRSFLLPLGLTATAVSAVSVQWGPCSGFNATVPIECGNLTVPLDYSSPNSTETLQLQLLRVPATKKPSNGSILFNFGGPGEPGRAFMALTAGGIQQMLGGYHDLVSWDTRGTGNALPFSCYPSELERTLSILTSPLFGNASDVAYGRLWAASTNYALNCQNVSSDIGGLVGTAFSARDMLRIVDAVEQEDHHDKMLKYWGFSYGTVLGATVAAMFPDRVGRLVLDGVQNPHEYYHGFDVEMVADTDKTWDEFFRGCLAAPLNCALAREGATYEQLRDTVYDLLYTLKYDPIPIGAGLIDYALAKGAIIQAMYSPTRWGPLATAINGLLTGNLTAVAAIGSDGGSDSQPSGESTQGIRCSDKMARVSKRADIMPAMAEFARRSHLFNDFWSLVEMQCAQWRMPAKEIYKGDFRVQTKNPMLIVGNTWDPLTPLISAKNLSETFAGSVLLEHRGHGHASLAEPSACSIAVIQAYFVNGTLPDEGKVCVADTALLSTSASGVAPAKRSVANADPNTIRAAEDVSLAWSRRRFA